MTPADPASDERLPDEARRMPEELDLWMSQHGPVLWNPQWNSASEPATYIRADIHAAALARASDLEAQVAALTATIDAQASVIGETRKRALEEALNVVCEVGESVRREKLDDPTQWMAGRLGGVLAASDAIAALRATPPEETPDGG